MAPNLVDADSALRLADALSDLAGDCSADADTTIAWLDSAPRAACPGGQAAQLRLGPPPDHPVLAVGFTSRGAAQRIAPEDEEKHLVRVTLAVSCCRTAVVLGRPDGRILHSNQADGTTVTVLRQSAMLQRCDECIEADDPPGRLNVT